MATRDSRVGYIKLVKHIFCVCSGLKVKKALVSHRLATLANAANCAQPEHCGGHQLVQVTRDCLCVPKQRASLFREASLSKEALSVVWRVGLRGSWLSGGVEARCQLFAVLFDFLIVLMLLLFVLVIFMHLESRWLFPEHLQRG